MTGARAERFVVLQPAPRWRSSFAVVGILFIARPQRRPRRHLRPRRRDRKLHPRARDTVENFWLALGFAYMVVITGICVRGADRRRPLPAALLVLAAGKTASSLAALGFYALRQRCIHLPPQLHRGRLPRRRRALPLEGRRPDRRARRAVLKAQTGAWGRRAPDPCAPSRRRWRRASTGLPAAAGA